MNSLLHSKGNGHNSTRKMNRRAMRMAQKLMRKNGGLAGFEDLAQMMQEQAPRRSSRRRNKT